MSKRNHKKFRDRDQENDREDPVRDTSPSSIPPLEWDPSADVGAQVQVPTNTPIHQPKHGANRNIHSEDLSALDQIVMALNSGYDLKPYVTESRTKRFGVTESRQSNSNSDGSNSSYRTATETDQDVVDPTSAEVTSLSSSWHTSGLTRSELQYKSKKDASTSRESSSSLLWIEVHPHEQSDSLDGTSSGKLTRGDKSTSVDQGQSEKKSIAVQASKAGKSNATNTKPYKKGKTQSTQAVPESNKGNNNTNSANGKVPTNESTKVRSTRMCTNSHYGHEHRLGCCTISIPSSSSAVPHCPQYYIPMPCHCHTMSVQGSGSGRSLGSHPRFQELSSEHSQNSSKSNGSSASPTCATLEKLINEDVASLQKYGYEALELHRNSVIRKMRKDFQHLEKLNKMLMDKRQKSNVPISSLEPSSSSESKTSESRDRERMPPPPPKSSSSSSSVTSKTDNVHVKARHHRQPAPTTMPTSDNTKERTQKSQETVEKKPPVCYFVPYQPCPNYMAQPPTAPMSHQRRENEDIGQPPGPSQPWYGEGWKENQRPGTVPAFIEYHNGQTDSDNYVLFENDTVQISLQQAFEQHCPSILASVQAREQIVNNLKVVRETRAEVKRDYFRHRQNCLSPNDSLNQALPANGPRLMSTKKMRELTEKKIKKLPEIREKEILRKIEEDKKTNRILSQVFSRKLRQHVLKGDMNIVHSRTLIRH